MLVSICVIKNKGTPTVQVQAVAFKRRLELGRHERVTGTGLAQNGKVKVEKGQVEGARQYEQSQCPRRKVFKQQALFEIVSFVACSQ